MFNPYTVRPIGSERYNNHLLDVFTRKYYENNYADCDEDLEKLAIYGHPIWKSEKPYDPFERLIIAVLVQAICDYIDAYHKRQKAEEDFRDGDYVLYNSYCLRLENEYFRVNEFTENIFDKLLYELHQSKDAKDVGLYISRNYEKYMQKCGKDE